jgi:hypothetical protein
MSSSFVGITKQSRPEPVVIRPSLLLPFSSFNCKSISGHKHRITEMLAAMNNPMTNCLAVESAFSQQNLHHPQKRSPMIRKCKFLLVLFLVQVGHFQGSLLRPNAFR